MSGEENSDEFTSKTQVRSKWLGSVVSVITILFYLVLMLAVATGNASMDNIPSHAFYILALIVLSASGWTFGIDMIEKYFGKK